MERVIVDMDEVIADPMGAMIEWYQKEYKLDVNLQKMVGTDWIYGFPEQHQQLVWDRLLAPGFFRKLPVFPDAVEVLQEMNKLYEVFIVSAAIEFPNSLKDKFEWLMEFFPFLTWKQLVLCGDKRIVHGDYMIDDHIWNLEPFNGKKYLFTSIHNTNVTSYDRLNNWREVAEVFLK